MYSCRAMPCDSRHPVTPGVGQVVDHEDPLCASKPFLPAPELGTPGWPRHLPAFTKCAARSLPEQSRNFSGRPLIWQGLDSESGFSRCAAEKGEAVLAWN